MAAGVKIDQRARKKILIIVMSLLCAVSPKPYSMLSTHHMKERISQYTEKLVEFQMHTFMHAVHDFYAALKV